MSARSLIQPLAGIAPRPAPLQKPGEKALVPVVVVIRVERSVEPTIEILELAIEILELAGVVALEAIADRPADIWAVKSLVVVLCKARSRGEGKRAGHGISTLSMTWITLFDCMTLAMVMLAWPPLGLGRDVGDGDPAGNYYE